MRPIPSRFVFLCGAHFDQIMRLDQMPVMGVSNPAKIEVIPGGAALNSASTASALGLDVTLLSPIGDDAAGQHLLDICAKRNIRPALIKTSTEPTGIYSAIFSPNGDIVIGASDLTIYNLINEEWLREHLHPRFDTQIGLFLNSNLDGKLLEIAVQNASFLAAATISPAKAKRLHPILDQLDCLFTNLGEARELAGLPDANARHLAERMINKGVKSGTLSQGKEELIFWHDTTIGALKPKPVENLVDVNGAGDALAGAVLAALAHGKGFPDAVAFAMKVAAYSLSRAGPFDPEITLKGPRLS